MGEKLEFQTWHRQNHEFYKVTSSAMTVDIKGAGYAYIGLSRKLHRKCDVWIAIAIGTNRDINVIYREDMKPAKFTLANSLSSQSYKTFIVSWYSGRVQLQAQSAFPPQAVSLPCDVPGIQYVTFVNIGEHNAVINWRIELPPQRPSRPLKQISGGAPKWVSSADIDQLPDGAMIGGFENESLYIIRAKHRNSLTPGKFVPSEGVGYIAWGGQAHEKNELEILCGYDVAWAAASDDNIPAAALPAGHSEDREPLFVGRAMHLGHLVPGKVQPSHKACYIPFEGKEIAKISFEVLVLGSGSRAANKVMFPHLMELPSPDDMLRPYGHHHSSDTDGSASDDEDLPWVAAF